MMKKVWFMLAMMVCIFASCSDGGGEEPITPTPKPEEVKTEITIDSGIISNGLSFSSAEGEQSVSFSVNADWTLSIASTTSGTTWCKASATSGSKGTANVKFTVSENTDYEDRSVSVTIKAGTVSKTFTITQKGADALLVTTTKYEVAQEGGQIEIEVKANIDYKMEISEEAKGWIKESSSRALTTYKHTLDIAMNEDAEKREGEITFKSGDKVETVNVYQAGGAILLLSQNEYNVSDKGDTISVDIKSNIDFGVQMPDVDWIIDEASSRGLSSHTLKYIVSANEGYDSRSAEIIFYDKNSDLEDTLKVAQAQKNAILVAKNEYTIDAAGGDLKFEINSNVDFEVSASVDWIKQNTESRGLEAKPLNFIIAENTADEAREGLITISSGEIKQEIKVFQKAKSVFTLSETEFKITSEGGEFKVEVSTNGEYTIAMPKVDWLKENESRAASTYTHTFTVSANETYDARETEITFINKETSEAVNVKVVQVQKDVIVISQKEYNVKAEGETIEVKLSANVDFEVTMLDVDWIMQVSSRALKEHTLYFKIAVNIGEENRSAEITFKDKNSNLSETVIITQKCPTPAEKIKDVVTIAKAGTMKQLLGDDWLDITTLKVVGPINGDDVRCLRQMLGGDEFSAEEKGSLALLDLSEAFVVVGGEWYYKNNYSPYNKYYTSNDMIGDRMFYYCDNLQDIMLPDEVTSIGERAFYGCSSMTSIDIPDGVISIGERAFYRCSSMTSINIPNRVTSIESGTFSNCSSLTSIDIPDGVTSIDEWAFSSCSSLTSIDIPDGVISIGNYIFDGCSSLISIDIPDGVTSIGIQAFHNCSSLTSIDIPDGVTSIDNLAFYVCSSLTSIDIPNGVTSIGSSAFGYCSSLTSIDIPDGVTSIDNHTFYGCSSMTAINIPDGVTSIGNYTFYGCSSLTSIDIPNGVTSIGNYTFYGCSSLTSIDVPDGVTSIGEWAFSNCSSLTSIDIPDGVTSIAREAFRYCSSLTSVHITDLFAWCSITFSDSSSNPLNRTGVKLYLNNNELTEIVIPANIKRIKDYAFYGYKGLTKISMGAGVTTVGIHSFRNCSSLTEVYCQGATPPIINPSSTNSSFNGSSDGRTLYVPKGYLSAYQSSNWASFFKIIKEME